MDEYETFTGLPAQTNEEAMRRWATTLARAVLALIVIGVVSSAILWPFSADGGALTLCIAFAACTGLLVIRQALLAERM